MGHRTGHRELTRDLGSLPGQWGFFPGAPLRCCGGPAMTAGVSAFVLKKGDTAPSISAILVNDGVAAADLTGATVRFVMRLRPACGEVANGAALPTVDAAAVVVDAETGAVRYDWAAGDTDIVGNYDAEFKVTIAGKESSYPSKGYNAVTILRSLG